MNLVFLVNGQKLTRVDKNELISDSEGYVSAQFVFNFEKNPEEMYDKIEAVFWSDEDVEYVEIDGISGKCLVPDKYLSAGSFKISLWIQSGETSSIPTNRVIIDVVNSGLKEVIRPDLYSKMEERISKIETKVKELEVLISNKDSDSTGGNDQNENE